MKTYARIQDEVVIELMTTDLDVASRFNPALLWTDVSNVPGIAPGWSQNASSFLPPAAPPIPAMPTVAQLQSQLDIISKQIAGLPKAT